MIDLLHIFENIKNSGLHKSEDIKKIDKGSQGKNYISDSAQENYQNAVWREYRLYIGEQIEDESTKNLVIKVLGPGCPACDRLMENVSSILSSMKIAAYLEHVRDIAT